MAYNKYEKLHQFTVVVEEIHYAKSGEWCDLDKRPRECVRLCAGKHIKSFLHLEEPIFYSTNDTHQSMRFAEITTALTEEQINAEDGPIMGRLDNIREITAKEIFRMYGERGIALEMIPRTLRTTKFINYVRESHPHVPLCTQLCTNYYTHGHVWQGVSRFVSRAHGEISGCQSPRLLQQRISGW